MEHKTCKKCKQEKPLKEFYKHPGGKYGVHSKCISCLRVYYKQNASEMIRKAMARRELRKDAYLAYRRSWERSSIQNRLRVNLRSRLRHALKGNYKTGSTLELLGCSIVDLKQHLEQKFYSGMTWDNYGQWHIDHIIPLCKFDLTNAENLAKACHYTNLQPLWAKDNMIKRGK